MEQERKRERPKSTVQRRLYTRADLAALGIPYASAKGGAQLWRLCREGAFPAPVTLHSGRAAKLVWFVDDIENWLAERKQARLTRSPPKPPERAPRRVLRPAPRVRRVLQQREG